MAGALAYAHAQGVVHRDIKPENILLGSGEAMVADFGIARALTSADPARLTGAGLAVGTPAYMSPEQATGSEEVDGRSDLYSLGCLLFEMLAGRPPFVGVTPESVVAQHVTADPPALAGIRPAAPAAVADVITRALAKAPADRFRSAEQMAQALAVPSGAQDTRPRAAPAQAPSRRRLLLAAVAGLVAVGALALWLPGRGDRDTAGRARPRTAIAVLPFQNLSPEGPHAYFAGGLHDEILTQLARLAALTVVSRTSVGGFSGRGLSVRQIAESLGVGSVVDGSVQVVEGRLRVSVQLIDPVTDAPIWADRYDRTLDDAFAIQSDVAQQIVSAVGAALSAAEQASLAQAPTANAEAYRLYLQGRDYWTRPGRQRQDYEAAEALYRRAIALDPDFALARVALTEVHGLMFLLRYDTSPARLAQLRQEAEAALRLDPDLPKAHEAIGMAYALADDEVPRAVASFTRAAEGLPNDARVRQKIGFSYRVLGVWDSALAAFRESQRIDPHDADLYFHLGITEDMLHQPEAALASLRRAHELAPDLSLARVAIGWVVARATGQLDTLQAVLAALPPSLDLGPWGEVGAHRATVHFLRRDPAGMLDALRPGQRTVYESELTFEPAPLFAAQAHRLAGDTPRARAALDSALTLTEARLAARPGDPAALAARGLIRAGLGDTAGARQDADALARATHRRHPGGYVDVRLREDQARILAQIGDAAGAVALIRPLLRQPSWLSPQLLRLSPIWDPIRGNPAFTALLREHGVP